MGFNPCWDLWACPLVRLCNSRLAFTTNYRGLKMDFKKTVNKKRLNDFSLAQLEALSRMLDGKATPKDYKILRGAK